MGFQTLVVKFLVTFLVLIAITDASFIIKGKVKKRNTIIKATDPYCNYDTSLFKNNASLQDVVDASTYIITGKISSVQKRKVLHDKSNRVVYKVLIRRVLKGDLSSLSEILNFETRTSSSSNRGHIYAESSGVKRACASAKAAGWSGIFFATYSSSALQLLVDPIPSSLERARRVKAVIKGTNFHSA